MPTLAPVAHFQVVEGESDRISTVTPMPTMKANAIVVVPADRNVVVFGTLGDIAAKASVTAT